MKGWLWRVVAGSLVLAVLAVAAKPQASPNNSADPLVGFWTNVTRFADNTPRELVISRRGTVWSASLAGVKSTFDPAIAIRFAIPDYGSFRGSLDRRKDVIDGFWIGLV